jgi:hypothetical protein
MSLVILSVAAFDTPYMTLKKCFRTAQEPIFTMSPRRFGSIILAASEAATKAAHTPASIMAAQRRPGCSQKCSANVNAPFSSTLS